MACFRSARFISRLPADRFDDPATVLSLIACAMAGSLHPMTIAILLNSDRRVLSVLTVDNTTDHDDVFGVAEVIVGGAAQRSDFSAVVLASIRPDWHDNLDNLDDLDRWLELDDEFDTAGLELIDWLVIGTSMSLPRELVGEPTRW